MGGTVREGGGDDGRGNSAGIGLGHVARAAERAELDGNTQCLGGGDCLEDVGTGLALDERLDGELKRQHGAHGNRRSPDADPDADTDADTDAGPDADPDTGRDPRCAGPRQREPITRCSSVDRATQSAPAASNA